MSSASNQPGACRLQATGGRKSSLQNRVVDGGEVAGDVATKHVDGNDRGSAPGSRDRAVRALANAVREAVVDEAPREDRLR